MRSKEFVKNPEINRIERTFTMMRKRFMWIGMLMLTLFRMGLAQPPDSTMQLSALIEEALENNPDLQSAQNTWQNSPGRGIAGPPVGLQPDEHAGEYLCL
jgi:hypothetical protein